MRVSAVNPTLDIIDAAMGESVFRTLIGALQTAGMIDLLKGSGPYTLLAPTDQAFEKLPAGAVQELEKPENAGKLTKLMRYHVVKGAHDRATMASRLSVQSIDGESLSVLEDAAGVQVNNARAIGSAIYCTNGTIHAIDAVLDPKFSA